MYWSADIGAAHIIALNTDTYLVPGMAAAQLTALQEQFAWLRDDLTLATAPAQRAKVPWIVAMGHEMLYSSHDAGHKSQAKLLREGGTGPAGNFEGLEDLFHEFGVDLYFSGHEHVYEHFARIYKSEDCTPLTAGTSCGLSAPCPCTAHIVVGNAGNREFPYRNKDGNRSVPVPAALLREVQEHRPGGFWFADRAQHERDGVGAAERADGGGHRRARVPPLSTMDDGHMTIFTRHTCTHAQHVYPIESSWRVTFWRLSRGRDSGYISLRPLLVDVRPLLSLPSSCTLPACRRLATTYGWYMVVHPHPDLGAAVAALLYPRA
jgi:hypothetical protein